ncbi:MAG: pyruvate, water dikinase regulatory protein [Bacillota bacterium]
MPLGGKADPVVYLISDSLGETAEFVVKAVASQFNIPVQIRREPYLTDLLRLQKILDEAAGQNSLIAYTLVKPELRKAIREKAQVYNLPIVDVMGPMLEGFLQIMPVEPRLEPGLIRRMDGDYFSRIIAVEFAVKYDDGKDPRGMLLADVVLVGVSRTSKTPLSMYLAHKQIKTANLPLIPEVEPAREIYEVPKSKVIGLTIAPELLQKIRQERLSSLGLRNGSNYASIDRILQELDYAQRIMRSIGCRVFDVSNKAVEEVAGKILKFLKESDRS